MEDPTKRQGGQGPVDGTEDRGLRRAVGEAPASEAEAGDPEQSEEQADDGGERAGAGLELLDPGDQFLAVLVEGRKGDHGARTAAPPGGDRGAGDRKPVNCRDRASLAHLVAEPVVVDAALLEGMGHQ
ncbi:MAG: hypothetical protein EXR72_24340 [Myxococcales bacterium]|nr:hypothetical protein [Myxococcales bacterium]